MESLMTKLNKSNSPTVTVDDTIGDYSNDKRVLKKLAQMNKIIAKSGLPDIYYEKQAKIKAIRPYNTDIVDQELAQACEPMSEYNASKQAEES